MFNNITIEDSYMPKVFEVMMRTDGNNFNTFVELLPEIVIQKYIFLYKGNNDFDYECKSVESMENNAVLVAASNIYMSLFICCMEYKELFPEIPKEAIGIFICMCFFFRVHRYEKEIIFNLSEYMLNILEIEKNTEISQ